MSEGSGAPERPEGPPPLAPRTLLAPGYIVIEHLSRARTLDVYDAWSEERGARCIVKGLRPDRADDARGRRLLLAEGRLLCRLSHPHIVRGYEVLREPRPLVVMETLTGATLGRMLDDDERLDVSEAAHMGLQLGSALRYLHARDVLHLDVKPSNVVAEAGRAKLIDLSVARRPGRSRADVGTWCYMSPEQARGGALGSAADVWGLGMVLFESLAGVSPFEDVGGPERPEDPADYPQVRERVPRLTRHRRAPAALADLIAACLEPGAADRPALVTVLAALEPLAEVPPAERFWGAAAA